jgi:hypothetical protein
MKIGYIDNMASRIFSEKWETLPPDTRVIARMFKGGMAGVYLLAYPNADKDLSGNRVKSSDVYYIGMTVSKSGLRGRLKGFIRSANGKSRQHSGGVEFFRQNRSRSYANTYRRRPLFFVTFSIECCTTKSEATANDFYEMGNVACLEYYLVAKVKKAIGKAPPLNRSVGGGLEI